MIRLFPFGSVSISDTARTLTLPLPVRYASSLPLVPKIIPPVGKSGALITGINSSISVSLSSSTRLSMIFTTALITSRRLWGGMLVAIPTAIPVVPLTNKFGKRLGRTVGSFSVSSKLGTESTVSLLMSASSSMEILESLASV